MSKIIDKQIAELESLFGEFRTTDANPCGGSVYYDEVEETDLPDDSGTPWRVHFADGASDESFRTYHEAGNAINTYRNQKLAEQQIDDCSGVE